MKKTKCGVIGVGYLGRFHAQKYQKIDNAELIGVSDVNVEACQRVANELNVIGFLDYTELLNQVDAVSIAATTRAHYVIAKECLKRGIHVLIEKPITETVAEAQELIRLAKENNATLQVGHLERFNSARLALEQYLDEPLFIESQRLAPFNPRGADVNVILDLMIHDIDIIQSMVKSPIVKIDAEGAPVLSKAIDIANARITFENHCVANVTASRVSLKAERKTRIFQRDTYLSLDYQHKKLAVFQRGTNEMFPGVPDIQQNHLTFEDNDALLQEIKAFITCIQHNTRPLVSGEEGCAALATAAKISELIEANLLARQI